MNERSSRDNAMAQSQTPIWHPIDKLPLIASVIDEQLKDNEEQLQNLAPPGRKAPVSDDALVARIIRVYTEQQDCKGRPTNRREIRVSLTPGFVQLLWPHATRFRQGSGTTGNMTVGDESTYGKTRSKGVTCRGLEKCVSAQTRSCTWRFCEGNSVARPPWPARFGDSFLAWESRLLLWR